MDEGLLVGLGEGGRSVCEKEREGRDRRRMGGVVMIFEKGKGVVVSC